MKRSKYIDHTLLKPEATQDQIEKLCQEAKQYDFASVCVNPYWVPFCKEELKDSDVKVCTVIGFPLGATSSASKAFETAHAIEQGADEVDMVMNVGELLAGHDQAAQGKIVKVILETCLLNDAQIERACSLCVKAKADFVKTSTGFNSAGANTHVVEVMKQAVKGQAKVKAAGGVRNQADMDAMIVAGADRIGTSHGIELM